VSVKYCCIFLSLAAVIAASGFACRDVVGDVAAVVYYPAFSFLLVGLAYGGLGPRVFLKRDRGRIHPAAWLPFAPYFALTILAYWLYLLASKEPPHAEAAPKLLFGRRLTPREARNARGAGWHGVLDLAVEFTEVQDQRALPGYRSFPLLDGTAPTAEQMREVTKWMDESLAQGPLYVHCALGHGRTSTMLIGYMLATGRVASVNEGLERLRAVRPGVKLDPQQEAFLKRLEPGTGA
jgi:predicted protein tyrosine phosphatase